MFTQEVPRKDVIKGQKVWPTSANSSRAGDNVAWLLAGLGQSAIRLSLRFYTGKKEEQEGRGEGGEEENEEKEHGVKEE